MLINEESFADVISILDQYWHTLQTKISNNYNFFLTNDDLCKYTLRYKSAQNFVIKIEIMLKTHEHLQCSTFKIILQYFHILFLFFVTFLIS